MASFKTAAILGFRPMVLPATAIVETVSVDINWADAGAGIGVGDVIQLAEVPPGFEVLDWKFVTDDIDSNAAPTVAFSLGVLNAGKTAIGGGTDAWTAAGAITAGQTAGQANPAGATAANCFLGGKATNRVIGLVATAATATAALVSGATSKRATLLMQLRSTAA